MIRRGSLVAVILVLATADVGLAITPGTLPPGGKLVPVDGIQIYVEQHGEGSPVVLLHNFLNAGSAWAFLTPELLERHRVVLVDLPGHGRSTGWHADVFDYPAAAKRIFRALDQIGVQRFALIGASTGGAVALRMAAEQPDRVDVLITLGGFDRITDEAIAILGKPGCEDLSPDQWTTQRQRQSSGDDQIRALQKQFCNELKNPHLLTSPALSQVKARTLIIQGDHDPFFPVRIGVDIYRAIPKAYLWVVPDGGHLPGFDGRERAAFIAAVRSFLGKEWQPKY